MNRSPKVSIIIPTFNRARYIKEALESVWQQTYKDHEVIVVDDGSTDNTKELVLVYGERVRYFYQTNKGAAAAKNFCVSQSRGEFIAFLDSDDAWLPQRLEQGVQYLQGHPRSAFVSGEAYIMDEHGRIVRHARLNADTLPTFENLFEFSFIHFSTVLVRKNIFVEAGEFDTDFRTSCDYDLWLRISKKYPFDCLRLPLAKYREHWDRLTSNLDSRLRCNLIIFRRPEITAGLSWIQKRTRIAKVYYQYAELYAEKAQFAKAVECFLMALAYCPFIGRYYWPMEMKRMRFSLPFRILKVYYLALNCAAGWILNKKTFSSEGKQGAVRPNL